jgi:hypothetical protein
VKFPLGCGGIRRWSPTVRGPPCVVFNLCLECFSASLAIHPHSASDDRGGPTPRVNFMFAIVRSQKLLGVKNVYTLRSIVYTCHGYTFFTPIKNVYTFFYARKKRVHGRLRKTCTVYTFFTRATVLCVPCTHSVTKRCTRYTPSANPKLAHWPARKSPWFPASFSRPPDHEPAKERLQQIRQTDGRF